MENLEWCNNQENIQHSQKNVVYRRNKNVLKCPKNISPKEKNEFFIRHHRDIINLMDNKVSRVKIIKDHKMPISLRYLSVISKKVRDFKNLYGSIEHLLKNNQIQMMMF